MEPAYASVDLGATNISCTVAFGSGTMVSDGRIPTRSYQRPRRILERIVGLVQKLTAQAGQRITGLGMGVPGLVDFDRGETLFCPNLPGHWRRIPVRDLLSSQLDCPVFLLNDVRMATLGELVYGHGRHVSTMAFFSLGTGIGGGIVIDRKLRLGSLGAAGELGHQTILPDGPLCGCGNYGCLETLASGPAISGAGVRLLLSGLAPKLHEITEGDLAKVNPESMAAAAREGDEHVTKAIVRAARFLGIGVANVVTVLHPELVVLGGGVAQIGPLLFDTVRRTVKESIGMLPLDNVEILPSELGDQAGLLGGIALAAKGGITADGPSQ